jgi:hypothetical protein
VLLSILGVGRGLAAVGDWGPEEGAGPLVPLATERVLVGAASVPFLATPSARGTICFGKKRGKGWGGRHSVTDLRTLAIGSQMKTYLGDVSVGAEDGNLHAERLPEESHGLEALLVIRPTATHKNTDVMLLEALLVLLESANDTLESRRDLYSICYGGMMGVCAKGNGVKQSSETDARW